MCCWPARRIRSAGWCPTLSAWSRLRRQDQTRPGGLWSRWFLRGSAALVSGTAAVLQQAFAERHGGNLPPASLVRAILVNSADDVEAPGPDYTSGFEARMRRARQKQWMETAFSPPRLPCHRSCGRKSSSSARTSRIEDHAGLGRSACLCRRCAGINQRPRPCFSCWARRPVGMAALGAEHLSTHRLAPKKAPYAAWIR